MKKGSGVCVRCAMERFRDFILSRNQQIIVGIVLSLGVIVSSVLTIKREKKGNIRVIKSQESRVKSQEPGVNLDTASLRSKKEKKPQTIIRPKVKFPININKASKEGLMEISGIGPVISERIIEYRKERGTFSKKEDIIKVKGIGPKMYEKWKDLITVD